MMRQVKLLIPCGSLFAVVQASGFRDAIKHTDATKQRLANARSLWEQSSARSKKGVAIFHNEFASTDKADVYKTRQLFHDMDADSSARNWDVSFNQEHDSTKHESWDTGSHLLEELKERAQNGDFDGKPFFFYFKGHGLDFMNPGKTTRDFRMRIKGVDISVEHICKIAEKASVIIIIADCCRSERSDMEPIDPVHPDDKKPFDKLKAPKNALVLTNDKGKQSFSYHEGHMAGKWKISRGLRAALNLDVPLSDLNDFVNKRIEEDYQRRFMEEFLASLNNGTEVTSYTDLVHHGKMAKRGNIKKIHYADLISNFKPKAQVELSNKRTGLIVSGGPIGKHGLVWNVQLENLDDDGSPVIEIVEQTNMKVLSTQKIPTGKVTVTWTQRGKGKDANKEGFPEEEEVDLKDLIVDVTIDGEKNKICVNDAMSGSSFYIHKYGFVEEYSKITGKNKDFTFSGKIPNKPTDEQLLKDFQENFECEPWMYPEASEEEKVIGKSAAILRMLAFQKRTLIKK